MKITQLKIIFITVFSFITFAESSMRKCMVLPIRDSVGGAIGFQVFNHVEKYLKASKWCYYQSNSDIINILTNYKNTLDQALQNPEVLKLVSDKTKAGSLIKVKLESMMSGMKVDVTVIGPNGVDIYFNQQTEIASDEIEVIAQTINNWLDVYEKNIPYDARVIGVLGSQFTIDLGVDAGIYNDYEINVVRPVKKQKHPLLKEVVDWKTMPIATAKIFHVGKTQSQAKVIKYDRETLVQTDDWIIISKNNSNVTNNEKLNYEIESRDEDDYKFGKLGTVGLFFNLGSGKLRFDSTSSKEQSGMNVGISLNTEIWATRNYWGGLDIDKHFGSHSKNEGSYNKDNNSLSYSKVKLKIGYKYLPLGFFYGPQIDGYVGYANYTYGHDTVSTDGITEFVYSGILFGGRGSIPVVKNVRAFIGLDFMLSPSFEQGVEIYGEPDSVRNYTFEFGGSYKYSPNTSFDGGIEYISNSAKFESSNLVINDSNLNFKAGAKFNF